MRIGNKIYDFRNTDTVLPDPVVADPVVPEPVVLPASEPETQSPSWGDLLVAHWKDNPLRWTLLTLQNRLSGEEEDPNFQITPEDVEGYEDFPQILQARNYGELLRYKQLADDFKLQRRVMAECGTAANVTAGLVAGLADPLNLATGLAGGVIANTGFKLFRISKRLTGWGGAAIRGAAGAATAAPLDIAVRSHLEERKPEFREYIIGASVSGVMGSIAGAAPTIWRNLSEKQRFKIYEAAEQLSKEYKTPHPVPTTDAEASGFSNVSDYELQNALGLGFLARLSPDVTLATSRFATGREFGMKAVPFSFSVKEGMTGEVVAQGTTVEGASQIAVNHILYKFQQGIQRHFKEYLNESDKYSWYSKKFNNWSTFNLRKGKAWKEFSDEFHRASLSTEEPRSKAVKNAVELNRNLTDQLVAEAVKAGVYDKPIGELKAKWTKEAEGLGEIAEKHAEEIRLLQELNAKEQLAVEVLEQSLEEGELKMRNLQRQIAYSEKIAAEAEEGTVGAAEKLIKFGEEKENAKSATDALVVKKQEEKSLKSALKGTQSRLASVENAQTELIGILDKLQSDISSYMPRVRSAHENKLKEAQDALGKAINETKEEIDFLSKEKKLYKPGDSERNALNTDIENLKKAKLGVLTQSDKELSTEDSAKIIEELNDKIRKHTEDIHRNESRIEELNENYKQKKARLAGLIQKQKHLSKLEKENTELLEKQQKKLKEIQGNIEKLKLQANVNHGEKPGEEAIRMLRGEKMQQYLEAHIRELNEASEIAKTNVFELRRALRERKQNLAQGMAKLEKAQQGGLTPEQSERYAYLKKRLEENVFTIEDISDIKEPYTHRVYRMDLLGGKKGKARTQFAHTLATAWQAEGSPASYDELFGNAVDTINKMLGNTNAEGKQFHSRELRGVELQRVINVPSHYISDFLVHDPLVIFADTARTLIPDIYLSKAFHTLNVDEILARLEDEKKSIEVRLGTNRELKRLDKDFKKTSKAITTVWNRLRGEHFSQEEWAASWLHTIKTANVTTKLGKMTFSTIYNLGSIQQHCGLGLFLKNFAKIKAAKLFHGDKSLMDLTLRAFDATEIGRFADIAEGLSYNKWVDGTARALVKMTGTMAIDRQCKQVVGYTIFEKIVKACLKIKAGRKLRPKVVKDLRELGIDHKAALDIAEQFLLHGEVAKGGIFRANFEQWDKTPADVLLSAIFRKQNEAVLTPTAGSVPGLFDSNWGSLIFQFQRCMAAAYSKNALPLAQDLAQGRFLKVGSAVFTCAAGSYLKEVVVDAHNGKERSDEERIKAAVENLDFLSWGGQLLKTINDLQQAADKPSLYSSKRVVGDVLGASVGTAFDAVEFGAGVYREVKGLDATRTEVQAARRLIPFNNMLWWSRMFDRGVDAIAPRKEQKPKKKKRAARWDD